MKERGRLVLLGVILAAVRPSAATRVELHVDLNERVSAVYHLACLAGTISCTRDAFERCHCEPGVARRPERRKV